MYVRLPKIREHLECKLAIEIYYHLIYNVFGCLHKGGKLMDKLIATLVSLWPIIVMLIVFYFFLVRPQKKRDKETKDMLNSLKVGDNITTIGGLCGKIVAIRDDVLTIEVGKDKVKLVYERWAVRDVDKPESAD